MDIHYDPPRHSPTADFAVGEICYRAILSGDCPLSHTYLHEPIEPDEEAQLAWFREHLKLDKPTGDETLESLVSAATRHSVNVWVKQASK